MERLSKGYRHGDVHRNIKSLIRGNEIQCGYRVSLIMQHDQTFARRTDVKSRCYRAIRN